MRPGETKPPIADPRGNPLAATPGGSRGGTLLVKNASGLVTMDQDRRELTDSGLFVRDGRIEQVGPAAELPRAADEILDLTGHILLPGLVNTHHHLFQMPTRVVPGTTSGGVGPWLELLYPAWARLTAEVLRAASRIGFAELLLSGCTTTFDQLYVFPNDCRLDDEIQCARELGIRFHAGRGSMTFRDPQGGPPQSLIESEDAVLADCRRVLDAYHDRRPGAMTRIVLAPSALYLTSPEFLRETARLAGSAGAHLHMHLAKSRYDEQYTLANFGKRPVPYLESIGWIADNASFAHCVQLDDADIAAFAQNGCGVTHCPSSNMMQPTGIPPVKRLLNAGVRVGIGVDCSANNSGHMLGELREVLLLARTLLGLQPERAAQDDENWVTARDVLELATRGGAALLGRDDIGSLEPGKRADFFALDLARVAYSGALHDPVAAVILCAPQDSDYTVIDGRVAVRQGKLTTLDLPRAIEEHNRLSRELVDGVETAAMASQQQSGTPLGSARY